MNSKSAAFVGFLLSLPFIITGFIISLRIEPFYSFLEAFPAIRNSSIFPLLLLLLFPVGAIISIRPVLKASNKMKRFHIVNIVLSSIMLIIFLLLSSALLGDAYRCDILKIPNCD